MANKKAKPKKNSKKSTPVNKRTTTKVKSAKEFTEVVKDLDKATSTKAPKKNLLAKILSINTLRMFTLELLGVFVVTTTFLAVQGHPLYTMFAVIGVYLALGHKHGAFFNPAFSFGAWVTRKIEGVAALMQVVAQFLGAMLAMVIMEVFVKNAGASATGATELFKISALPSEKAWLIFLVEVIGTLLIGFFLARTIKTKRDSNIERSLAVGGGLFAGLLLAGTLASYIGATASLNPGIALALKAFSLTNVSVGWALSIYIIAPLIGGCLGFLLADFTEEK